MRFLARLHAPVTLFALVLAVCIAVDTAKAQPHPERFVGDYSGSADVIMSDGSVLKRDMSVSIRTTKEGFSVKWISVSYLGTGVREKSYEIAFLPTDRSGVFSAGMTRNVFGHAVQLDPMKGEPYVWARIIGDTLTVFSLFVDAQGGYEIQQYDRTLVEGGLQLDFQRFDNGVPQKAVSTFLEQG